MDFTPRGGYAGPAPQPANRPPDQLRPVSMPSEPTPPLPPPEPKAEPAPQLPQTPQPGVHAKPMKPKLAWLKPSKSWWKGTAALLAVIAFTGLVYGYLDTKNQLSEKKNQSAVGANETEQLVNKISQYLVLPDETPTLITISDIEKLKTQEFFKEAQNGDKVLVFANAGRALIYRPNTGQVVEYAKVNLNASTNAQQP